MFHCVALVVSNRKRAVAWFTHKLGLDVIEQDIGHDTHWVVVGRKGQKGGVHLRDMPTFNPAFPVEPGNRGLSSTPLATSGVGAPLSRRMGLDSPLRQLSDHGVGTPGSSTRTGMSFGSIRSRRGRSEHQRVHPVSRSGPASIYRSATPPQNHEYRSYTDEDDEGGPQ